MEKFVTKSNKANREIATDTPAVLNLRGQELIDTLGAETVDAYLLDKVKIATRSKIRLMLEKTDDAYMTDDEIQAAENWAEFVPQHQERKPNQAVEKAKAAGHLDAGIKMAKAMQDNGMDSKTIQTMLVPVYGKAVSTEILEAIEG